ncbi:MAG: ABC transporter ATP-binding protein [Eubacteriales bacterium]|nr:ABC transporter ATP-binding protein [Eubacteriales bacterium]
MSKKQTLHRLLRIVLQYKGRLAALLFGALITTVGSLLLITLNGAAIDRMAAGGSWMTGLVSICLQLIGVSLITSGGQYLLQRIGHRLTNQMMFDIRRAIFAKLDRLPVATADRLGKGGLANYILADAEQLSDGFLQAMLVFLSGTMMVIGTMILMLLQHLWIGLFIVAMTPFSLLIVSFISRRTYQTYRQVAVLRADLSSLTKELLQQEVLVATYGYEEEAKARFDRINEELAVTGLWGQFYASLPNPSTRLLNNIIFCAVGMMAAFSAVRGLLTIGDVANFLSYVRQYTKPFNEITNVIAQLQSALVSGGRIFDFLSLPERPSYEETEAYQAEKQKPALATTEASEVSFSGVDFSYQSGRPVLKNISFTVKKGEKIALVGKTGCGKTTLVQLLLRHFAIDRGQIKLSGRSLDAYSDRELYGRIGMVAQDVWIFHGSIADNLRYGRPQATDEEVRQAAAQAFLHDTIQQLPRGYQTVIAPEQSILSNGQLQLLCIARLMLLDPQLIILDEATSNIDTLTEVYIQRALFRLMSDRTALIIAHRLSTIRECDRILVMDSGEIIESGSHQSLLDKGGLYAEIYQSQFRQV